MQSGIYLITCARPGQLPLYYVGQSMNIRHRFKNHRNDLKAQRHGNRWLQAAANKYGLESLFFEVIENCSASELNAREQWWLDEIVGHPRCLNFAICAMSPKRGLRLSEQQKAQISERQRGAANPWRGKKHSDATIALQSEVKKGANNPMYGKKASDFSIRQRSERMKAANITKRGADHWQAQAVEGRCETSGKVISLRTITEARQYGFTPSAVGMVCLGKRARHKGFVWRYVT